MRWPGKKVAQQNCSGLSTLQHQVCTPVSWAAARSIFTLRRARVSASSNWALEARMAASRLPLSVNSETSAALPVRRGPTCTGTAISGLCLGVRSQINFLASHLVRRSALLCRVLPGWAHAG